jgi:hypothetical protein
MSAASGIPIPAVPVGGDAGSDTPFVHVVKGVPEVIYGVGSQTPPAGRAAAERARAAARAAAPAYDDVGAGDETPEIDGADVDVDDPVAPPPLAGDYVEVLSDAEIAGINARLAGVKRPASPASPPAVPRAAVAAPVPRARAPAGVVDVSLVSAPAPRIFCYAHAAWYAGAGCPDGAAAAAAFFNNARAPPVVGGGGFVENALYHRLLTVTRGGGTYYAFRRRFLSRFHFATVAPGDGWRAFSQFDRGFEHHVYSVPLYDGATGVDAPTLPALVRAFGGAQVARYGAGTPPLDAPVPPPHAASPPAATPAFRTLPPRPFDVFMVGRAPRRSVSLSAEARMLLAEREYAGAVAAFVRKDLAPGGASADMDFDTYADDAAGGGRAMAAALDVAEALHTTFMDAAMTASYYKYWATRGAGALALLASAARALSVALELGDDVGVADAAAAFARARSALPYDTGAVPPRGADAFMSMTTMEKICVDRTGDCAVLRDVLTLAKRAKAAYAVSHGLGDETSAFASSARTAAAVAAPALWTATLDVLLERGALPSDAATASSPLGRVRACLGLPPLRVHATDAFPPEYDVLYRAVHAGFGLWRDDEAYDLRDLERRRTVAAGAAAFACACRRDGKLPLSVAVLGIGTAPLDGDGRGVFDAPRVRVEVPYPVPYAPLVV